MSMDIIGVGSPAIPSLIPTKVDKKYTVLIDSGATSNATPVNLLQFALMGSVYYSYLFKEPRPKVGILTNGSEEYKGNALVKKRCHS